MAFVYWIHLPEHTDMFSEGYIGFTGKTVKERFKKHVQDAYAKNRRNYKLHNCIRKYGPDNLLIDTIVEGSEDYCLWLENKLRPIEEIGLNHNSGGVKPCGRKNPPTKEEVLRSSEKSKVTLSLLSEQERSERSLRQSASARASEKVQQHCAKLKEMNTGRVWDEHQRKRLSDALVGREFSDAHKKAISSSKIGILRDDETKRKISETKLAANMKPWNHPMAILSTWADADRLYSIYLEHNRCGHKKLRRLSGSSSRLLVIVDKFIEGWSPSEDVSWITFKEQYLSEQEANNAIST